MSTLNVVAIAETSPERAEELKKVCIKTGGIFLEKEIKNK